MCSACKIIFTYIRQCQRIQLYFNNVSNCCTKYFHLNHKVLERAESQTSKAQIGHFHLGSL